jgi:predicted enzyme related to lactoylglutathione lyase
MTNGNKLPIELRSVYFQLRVKDLLRAKKFYEDLFGFEVTWFMSPKAGWCEFRLPGGDFRLGLNAVQEGEDFDPMWGRLTLDVKDLIATKKYLHEKGVETSEIFDIPSMVSYFNLKDSEGNTIQVVSDPRVE